MTHSRNHFDRYAGERQRYQAAHKRGRWSNALRDEMLARGWRFALVDRKTGEVIGRDEHRPGVWVMRYTGFDSDEAVVYARNVPELRIKAASRR